MDLLQPWNLPFILPFSGALLYLFLLATGTVPTEQDSDADLDADIDHDVADLDHDVDHGIEHYTGDHGSLHGDTHHTPSTFSQVLGFLGIGRVPLSIIMMSFCFIWGFTGWAGNQLFADILRFPVLYFWPSAALALFSAVFGTKLLARGITHVMPSTESYSVSMRELVGKRAEVRYELTEGSGSVFLRDPYGNLLELPCRVKQGEATIPYGSPVILMGYDEREKAYVARYNPIKDLALPEMPSEEKIKRRLTNGADSE